MEEASSKTSTIQAQKVDLPKGGGAIKGLGETFAPDAFSGTGSYSVPLALTAARGFEPHLALSYQSGSGNGPLGLGFSVSLPSITRRTELGIPRYDPRDTFVYGGDWLVLTQKSQAVEGWSVDDYRPRVDEDFSQIQHWTNLATGESYWQVVTRDNTTLTYGKSAAARIADADDATRIFEWLIEQAVDAKGNKIVYAYLQEDDDNLPPDAPWEVGRALSQKYIHRIQYGNFGPAGPTQTFAFEVVFDYGQYDVSHLSGRSDPHTPPAGREWRFRPDPFSSYRSGFEIRTRRRCHNVLLFHHFEKDLGAACLVKRWALSYADDLAGNPAGLSLLQSVTLTGCRRQGMLATDPYDLRSLPPVTFGFSAFLPPDAPIFRALTIGGNEQSSRPFPTVGFQHVDLEAEGIAGLLYEAASTLWYLTPQGDGCYAPPRPPETFPIDRNFRSGRVSLRDIDGNGQLDVAITTSASSGFYGRNDDGSWAPFMPFAGIPIEVDAPYLEAASLSANGRTDALVVRPDGLTLYESLGYAGYAPAVRRAVPDGFPLPATTDNAYELVMFGDLFGDGLSHRIRITNGCVECWPDLGYGQFGPKVTLGNAPIFDESFDASRLHLADIDGSGVLDLIYVYPDRVALHMNQSGNGFAPPITVALPETFTPLTRIGFADILGNGTTCLTYTKAGPAPRHEYYNFVGETSLDGIERVVLKPYLLTDIDNNMGATTHIQYASSTKFLLADKQAGRPWVTKLRFPVQVVEHVVTTEAISGSRFIQRFAYHDGFYDTVEREFRGFGYVESWDAETFGDITSPEYVPPVYTRSWYHTGAVDLDGAIRDAYQQAYYAGDANAYDLPPSILPTQTSPETLRQAHVALRGHVIREEIYGEDASPLASSPYTVEESNFQVNLIQAADDSHPYAVFTVQARETIAYHYERNPLDPRVAQGFTLQVDAFGNVEQAFQIALPRRGQVTSPLAKATLTVDSYINVTTPFRQLGAMCESQGYEVGGLTPASGSQYFTFADVSEATSTALQAIVPYGTALDGTTIQAAQLSWSRTAFWDEAQSQPLPLGQLTARALVHHVEEAVFPESFLQTAFSGLLTADTVTESGGYWLDPETDYYWNRGLVQYYCAAAKTPEDPMTFFLPSSTENSFAEPSSSLYAQTTITYDDYYLHATSVSAFVNATTANTTSAIIDYAVCAPTQMVDINGNVAQVLLDPLGQVIVSTLFGIKNGAIVGGMVLIPFGDQRAEYVVHPRPSSIEELLSSPDSYLQGASNYFFYEADNWRPRQQPCCSLSLVRYQDYHTRNPLSDPSCRTTLSYVDGLGRILVQKLQVADQQWQNGGRTVYNNKGEPCEQYLPYFSDNYAYEFEPAPSAVSPTRFYYDPLMRLIRTVTPKLFFTKVEFTPWEISYYDEDDTIVDSEYYKWFMKHYPPDPTPQQQDEKNALDKAALFYDTPRKEILDTLGHVLFEIETQADGRPLCTSYQTDILGRVTESIDPRLYQANQSGNTSNFNFRYHYAMGDAQPVRSDSADAGLTLDFRNMYGAPVWQQNARGCVTTLAYDNLQRLVSVSTTQTGGDAPITAEVNLYGEGQPDASALNLCGRLYQHKDAAGITTHVDYHLRGEPKTVTRQLAADYKSPPNWDGTVPLDATIYVSSFTYDAVGHLLAETTPDQSVTTSTYNQAGLLAAIGVTFSDNTSQQIIGSIAYNANDQRTSVTYGNGVQTSYTYEPTTTRVVAITSTRPADTLQAVAYTYDPVGNVTRVRNNAIQAIFHKNQQVTPLNDYTYDALYRLTQAKGRQHIGIAADTYMSNAPAFKQSFFCQAPLTDPTAVENYTEVYRYDDAGNMIEKRHNATSYSWVTDTSVETASNRLSDQAYDASGNLLALQINGTVNLTYDVFDNLASAGVISRPGSLDDCDYYVYNSGRQRALKVSERMASGGALTQIRETVYLGNYGIRRDSNVANGTKTITKERHTLRIMDSDKCVVVVHHMVIDNAKPANVRTLRFQLADRQDSLSFELDPDARLISYEEYFPYGGTSIIAGPNQAEVKLKVYRYCGKECDDSTGLYYYGARYYAPWLGRWLNPDPAGTVDGLNLFALVKGNPETHDDINGLMFRRTHTLPFKSFPTLLRPKLYGKTFGDDGTRSNNQSSFSTTSAVRDQMVYNSKEFKGLLKTEVFIKGVNEKRKFLKREGLAMCHFLSILAIHYLLNMVANKFLKSNNPKLLGETKDLIDRFFPSGRDRENGKQLIQSAYDLINKGLPKKAEPHLRKLSDLLNRSPLNLFPGDSSTNSGIGERLDPPVNIDKRIISCAENILNHPLVQEILKSNERFWPEQDNNGNVRSSMRDGFTKLNDRYGIRHFSR